MGGDGVGFFCGGGGGDYVRLACGGDIVFLMAVVVAMGMEV